VVDEEEAIMRRMCALPFPCRQNIFGQTSFKWSASQLGHSRTHEDKRGNGIVYGEATGKIDSSEIVHWRRTVLYNSSSDDKLASPTYFELLKPRLRQRVTFLKKLRNG